MTGDILVLGGEGMLGHKMFQVLGQRFPAVACTVRGPAVSQPERPAALYGGRDVADNVDAMDFAGLARLLDARRPAVIVNCIGVIKQRADARLAVPSITLNSLLPHWLAETSSRWQGRVIHFSTDCVFSGRRGGYTEDDPCDAEDLYGRSKHMGEVQADNALTLRTSIIGRELSQFRSLLEWFLAQNGGTVRGFTRHLYSGVTTNHLARVVGDVIERHAGLSGLYQVTSATICKHDLLVLLRDAFRLNVEIVPDGADHCDRSMRGDRFRAATGIECPPWPALCADLAADPTPYQSWRIAP